MQDFREYSTVPDFDGIGILRMNICFLLVYLVEWLLGRKEDLFG